MIHGKRNLYYGSIETRIHKETSVEGNKVVKDMIKELNHEYIEDIKSLYTCIGIAVLNTIFLNFALKQKNRVREMFLHIIFTRGMDFLN